jgi:hypothetical protein
MAEVSQRTFLDEAKRRLSELHPNLTWEQLADLAGIEPRALKAYRVSAKSVNYREMPNRVRAAIEKLLAGIAKVSTDCSEPVSTELYEDAILPSALAALVFRQARQAIFNDRPISGRQRYPGDHVGLELEDRKAMALVSRARLRMGLADVGAEIHELLFQCTQPLGTWLPLSEIHAQRLSNVILLDTEESVPTREAEELARRFTSSAASLEELLFGRFREQLAKSSRIAATGYYSRVREFVIRNPVISGEQLSRLTVDLQLPASIGVLINQHFYEPISSGWGEGHINICGHCGNATKTIAGGDHCRTKACAESQSLTIKGRLPVDGSYRLKRGIRQYWLEPGIDEIRLYDELLRYGLSPSLYPELDRVDIAVADVGIDLKAYISPELLGARLAGDMGGLKYYKRKWLVIPDRLITRVPAYMERLRGALGGSSIHALPLSSVVRELSRA